MFRLCSGFRQVVMRTIYRTSDEELLAFLSIVRCAQPLKTDIAKFFAGRHLDGFLVDAVRFGLRLSREKGQTFSWLCVTNKGAEMVNRAALTLMNITEEDVARGFRGDPKIDGPNIVARVGLQLRPTRNLDNRPGVCERYLGVCLARALSSHLLGEIDHWQPGLGAPCEFR